jgi:predicted RNase H-like HicB family nuclease
VRGGPLTSKPTWFDALWASDHVGFFSGSRRRRGDPSLKGSAKLALKGTIRMKLAIRIKQQPNGTYWAHCPSLPGCFACGQTQEEARSNIDLAVRGYLASLNVSLPWELHWTMAMA